MSTTLGLVTVRYQSQALHVYTDVLDQLGLKPNQDVTLEQMFRVMELQIATVVASLDRRRLSGEKDIPDTTELKRLLMNKLTMNERHLLEWLSKRDFSQYGECYGAVLDTLVSKGLAQVHDAREAQSGFIAQGDTDMHRAVSLTDAGRAIVSEVPEGESRGRN